MPCCPKKPPASKLYELPGVSNLKSGSMSPEETISCYASRVGDEEQKPDASDTEPFNDKIQNSDIVIRRSGDVVSIDEDFKLTPNSTKTAATWELDQPIPGITFSGNKLSGNFSQEQIGKTFNPKVTAKDSAGELIDTRKFSFTPTKENKKGDALQLISPLPGSIIKSPYGMRKHPISGGQKMHTGIDLALPGRKIGDIVSAADGEVIAKGGCRGKNCGYGLFVHVLHKDSSGKPICITTYNHLEEFYVEKGQKVMAGQKLAKEGSTGGSTGPHLHFEVKSPDGKYMDPAPLIRGNSIQVDAKKPDGEPTKDGTSEVKGGGSLSAEEVKAKQKECAKSGVTSPDNPNPTEPAPEPTPTPPGSTNKDPFDAAWNFTMRYEVGPHWGTSPQYSPGDSDLDAGLVETKEQRKKTGYKGWDKLNGGVTKFGISEASRLFNAEQVKALTYAQARDVGYNKYWKTGPSKSLQTEQLAPLVSTMMFDVAFMTGPEGVATIRKNAGVDNISAPMSRQEQIVMAEKITSAQLNYMKTLKNWSGNATGWTNRANARLAYVKSLDIGG